MTPAGRSPAPTGAPTAPPGDRLRVLVVEDDPTIARLHRGFVESHPRFVVVGEARTAAEALRAFAVLDPDVVLLDIYLPDATGLHVLRQIRRRPSPPVDVVATTAARELESVRVGRRFRIGQVSEIGGVRRAPHEGERVALVWDGRLMGVWESSADGHLTCVCNFPDGIEGVRA